MLNANMYRTLFELWADEAHPKSRTIRAILGWLIVLGLIGVAVGLILAIWFNFWWKISLASIGVTGLAGLVKFFYEAVLVDAWKSSRKKKR